MGILLMNRKAWLLPAVCMAFLSGCASWHKAGTDKSTHHAPSVAKPPVRSVTSADGLVKGEIVGTITPASKFSQLQIGMTLEQVEHLIGKPDKSDSRITGKQYQPFYFGGDTQRTEAYYKGEGHLTF
jgi:outer membrane protein assembly factor BamE (lipoprotein component of BamABCDE complex)